MKRALITGITGQDGSYLSELLLEKGYEVYGIVRRSSNINTKRIDHLLSPTEKVKLVYGDLTSDLTGVIYDINPDEIYNIGAQSHVRISFDTPEYTINTNTLGPLRILEAIRKLKLKTRFLQCSSSEMFGMTPPPQNELSIFQPCSPYGVAKLAAYWLTKTYRDGYGIFASNSICFNHESPRRSENFVTKKIVRAAVRIKLGKQKNIELGNLDAKRDWGYSKDYVEAIYLILQHSEPDDFIIATNEIFTVKEFLEKVFSKLDLDYKEFLIYNGRYKRPKEVPALMGDYSKIKRVLNWEPKHKIDDIINLMIEDVMKEELNGIHN